MLKIGAPIRIVKVFGLAGERHEVAVSVRPPSREFVRRVSELEEGAEEAFWAPEVLLPFLISWEGLGDAEGNPLPLDLMSLSALRVAAASVYSALVSAVFDALPRRAEEERGN